MADFDVDGARKAITDTGKSLEEANAQIRDYLVKERNFDLEGAQQAGATDDQVIQYLSDQGPAEVSIERPSTAPGTLPLQLPDPGQQIPVTFGPSAETIRPAIRPTLEAVGSTAGSAIGFAAAGPPGAVAGGTLGLAGASQLSDVILGEAPEGLGENLLAGGEKIYEGIKLEAMGLVGGKFLTKLGKAIFRGGKFAKPLTKAAGRQIQRLRSAEKLGVPVTLGEGLDSQSLLGPEDFFRELAGPRFIPGAKFQKFDEKGFKSLLKARENLIKQASGKPDAKLVPRIEQTGRQIQSQLNNLFEGKINAKGEVMEKLRNEALETFGGTESFEALGRTGQEVLESKQLQFEELASTWFNKASEALPNGGEDVVNTSKVLGAIDESIKKAQNLLVTERTPVLDLLNKLRNDFITQDATGKPLSNITYNKLIARRSGVGAAIRGLETPIGVPGQPTVVTGGKKISRLFKPVMKAIDDDLVGFAKATGTDVDKFVKTGLSVAKRKFDFVKNPAIKQLMRSRPEQFLDILLKPNQVDTMKLLTKELSSAELEPLRKVAVNNLLSAGPDELLTATALKKNITKAGDNTLKTLFGADDFNQLVDLQRKLMAHERGIARIQVKGTAPKGLGLSDIDLASNKFWKQLIKTQKPQNIANIIYQPGNTQNIKKTYAALRAGGNFQTVQDLKASLIEQTIPLDPKTGNILLKEANKNLNSLGDDTLKAAFSESELAGIREIGDVIELIERRRPGGSNISVFREVFEPIAAPLAWIYLRADGRNQLKKVLRMAVSEASREAKNAAMVKLIAIGTKAQEQSQRKRDDGR